MLARHAQHHPLLPHATVAADLVIGWVHLQEHWERGWHWKERGEERGEERRGEEDMQ